MKKMWKRRSKQQEGIIGDIMRGIALCFKTKQTVTVGFSDIIVTINLRERIVDKGHGFAAPIIDEVIHERLSQIETPPGGDQS